MPSESTKSVANQEEIGTYHVQQYELHISTYEVEARGVVNAIRRVLDGDGSLIEPSPELCGVLDDRGIPVEEGSELAKALQELGVPMIESKIASICSVKKQA